MKSNANSVLVITIREKSAYKAAKVEKSSPFQNPKALDKESTLIRGQDHIHWKWSQEKEGLHGHPVRNGKNRP